MSRPAAAVLFIFKIKKFNQKNLSIYLRNKSSKLLLFYPESRNQNNNDREQ